MLEYYRTAGDQLEIEEEHNTQGQKDFDFKQAFDKKMCKIGRKAKRLLGDAARLLEDKASTSESNVDQESALEQFIGYPMLDTQVFEKFTDLPPEIQAAFDPNEWSDYKSKVILYRDGNPNYDPVLIWIDFGTDASCFLNTGHTKDASQDDSKEIIAVEGRVSFNTLKQLSPNQDEESISKLISAFEVFAYGSLYALSINDFHHYYLSHNPIVFEDPVALNALIDYADGCNLNSIYALQGQFLECYSKALLNIIINIQTLLEHEKVTPKAKCNLEKYCLYVNMT